MLNNVLHDLLLMSAVTHSRSPQKLVTAPVLCSQSTQTEPIAFWFRSIRCSEPFLSPTLYYVAVVNWSFTIASLLGVRKYQFSISK